MAIDTIKPNPISFGCYKHILKTLFKRGQMPTVTHGLYGRKLTRRNISAEHLLPKSLGGDLSLGNIALADRDINAIRGNQPLIAFLSWEKLEAYLSQFNFKIPGKFDGFQYQKLIRATCAKLGVQPPTEIAEQITKDQLPKKILKSMRNKAKKGLDVIA